MLGFLDVFICLRPIHRFVGRKECFFAGQLYGRTISLAGQEKGQSRL